MKELKLSELDDNIEIAKEETSSFYTVGELKREILKFDSEDHFIGQWFTVEKKRWQPCAQSMIESYIDGQSDEMYEDWSERALDCVSESLIDKVQKLLNGAFEGDDATVYWEWDKPVEIDILPKSQ
ncbi:hypothetical protein H7992_07030 [Sporosarcina sp. resist]|uniref:hypothetical protein n=1 Tax=Sporosarcina sp. resist TaxID=2762563 RepID=UPI00164CDF91|nr:hypothetical protein [Sporosarcina sp. resist]QNK89413.1 hypothetical protein H7992_07030 [Sporosarcina sp. resist]